MASPDPPDYYKILGAPADADATEIRRAFRRKVKEIHPDVAVDKTNANEAFLRVKEAYAVLSDPSRRTSYDLTRANMRARAREASGGFRPGGRSENFRTMHGPRPGPRAGAAPPPGGATFDPHRKRSAAELMQDATKDMLAGRYQAARAKLSEALAYEPYNPDALVLMGRLYESIGQHKEWIRLLEESLRKNPGQPALRLALNEARKAETRRRDVTTWTDEQRDQRRSAYRAFGIPTAALVFLWGMLYNRDASISLLGLGGAPWPLLIGGLACSFLLAWTFASTDYVEPADDELFFSEMHARPAPRAYERNEMPPLGLAVPFVGLIHFSVAALLLGALMWMRGCVSRSILIACGTALGVTFAMVIVAHGYRNGILWWCPGWLLSSYIIGWFLGDMFRV